MGREVRRVPADWQHPKDDDDEHYKPLYDKSFENAAIDWKRDLADFEDQSPEERGTALEYWEWNGNPPDRDTYRPNWPAASRTHYQLYETVTEGTPLSPPMPSLEDLALWLANNGDYWTQWRPDRNRNKSYETWLAFLKQGWAPSMVVEVSSNSSKVIDGVDFAAGVKTQGDVE